MNRPVLSPFFWRSAVTVAPVTGSPPSSRTRPVITPAVARAIVRFSTFWPSERSNARARRTRPARAQRGVHVARLRGAQTVAAFGHPLEHERPGGVGRHRLAVRLMTVAEGHLRPPQREAGVGGHDPPADHAGAGDDCRRPGRGIPRRAAGVRPGSRLRRKRDSDHRAAPATDSSAAGTGRQARRVMVGWDLITPRRGKENSTCPTPNISWRPCARN